VSRAFVQNHYVLSLHYCQVPGLYFFMPPKPRILPSSIAVSNESTGERIARFRKRRGLTQKELSKIIGIDRATIANYELGRSHIYDELLARFALALRVSADELLGITAQQEIEHPATLRIIKRVKKIEKLPPSKQRAILQTLDMVLNVNDS